MNALLQPELHLHSQFGPSPSAKVHSQCELCKLMIIPAALYLLKPVTCLMDVFYLGLSDEEK